MRRKHLLEGEKRLILSVLEDAVECFMKCIDSTTNKGQRLFRDADDWINLEDKHWVFSFDNVCEMLDIEPEYSAPRPAALERAPAAGIAERAATAAQQATLPAAPVAESEPEVAVPAASVIPASAKVFRADRAVTSKRVKVATTRRSRSSAKHAPEERYNDVNEGGPCWPPLFHWSQTGNSLKIIH